MGLWEISTHSGPTCYMAHQNITDYGNFTMNIKELGFCALLLLL